MQLQLAVRCSSRVLPSRLPPRRRRFALTGLGPRRHFPHCRAQMPAQDAYLASRAEALQNVERTIAELGTIFQQLARPAAAHHSVGACLTQRAARVGRLAGGVSARAESVSPAAGDDGG